MRITFDGAGDGFGQESGIAGGEVVAQLEAAITQASSNSSRDGRGRGAVFFMPRSNVGQLQSLDLLRGSGLIHLGGYVLGTGGALVGFAPLGPITAPGPAGPEHAS